MVASSSAERIERRLRRSQGSSRRAAAVLLGGLASVAYLSATRAYVGAGAAASGPEVAPRRSLLIAAGAGVLAPAGLWMEAASAEEAKPARPPENLEVTGGKADYKKIEGRWTIAFGKKVNGKIVYKKDGQKLYLNYNDCGEFQIDEVAKGTCDGFGVQKAGVWTFNGNADPEVKVRPIGKGEQVGAQKKRESESDLMRKVQSEMASSERELTSATFMGNLEKEQDEAAARMMAKMGAKIADGF